MRLKASPALKGLMGDRLGNLRQHSKNGQGLSQGLLVSQLIPRDWNCYRGLYKNFNTG